MEAIPAIPILAPVLIDFEIDPAQVGGAGMLNRINVPMMPVTGLLLPAMSRVDEFGPLDTTKAVFPHLLPLFAGLILLSVLPRPPRYLPDHV